MATPTFLVDSSLVPAAIGASTPDHSAEFEKAVAGGKVIITVYVRMEVVRRLVCGLIKMGLMAAQCTTTKQFWHYYQQAFAKGDLKIALFAFGEGNVNLLRAETPAELSEEFINIAINTLKMVDRRLPQSGNRSQCQIGAKKLVVDFNMLLDDAKRFLVEFSREVLDCGINDFLKLGNFRSEANKLIADADAGKTDAVTNLKQIRDEQAWITCNRCKKIGDPVIAIEQPQRAKLIHGDNKSFPKLCKALKKEDRYIASVQALEHAKPEFIFKIGGKVPDQN